MKAYIIFRSIVVFILSFLTCLVQAQVKVESGEVQVFPQFKSKFVNARNIEVWLPPNYQNDRAYPVLYMHDGQMLFDSTHTWNHQEWNMDGVAGHLIKFRDIEPFIIVGIDNSGEWRHSEYFPEDALLEMTEQQRDSVLSVCLKGKAMANDYLRFVFEELKPFVDSTFSTKTSGKHTYMGGASMGGLISMYAMCKYPKALHGVFGLSTHWPGCNPGSSTVVTKAMITYFDKQLPSPFGRLIYMDRGTEGLDAGYVYGFEEMERVLKQSGWRFNSQLHVVQGGEHNEQSWSARTSLPLMMLFGIYP